MSTLKLERMKSSILFAILVVINSIEFIQSCGVTTHIEIAHRAFSHFDYLFEKNISVFKVNEHKIY